MSSEVKTIRKSFKYRIYPTKEQEEFFNKCFGHGRYVWNYFLDLQNELYEYGKVRLSKFDMDYALTDLRKDIEWLQEVPSVNLRLVLESLDNAWQKFFRKDGGKMTGKPKFKAKGYYETTTFAISSTSENIYISSEGLKLPKLKELVKVKYHREHEGKIKRATIKRSSTGKYFVSLSCKIEKEVKENEVKKEIGIDIGIRNFVTLSNEKVYENPKYYEKLEKKLATAQRHLSRKKKGSNRYKKQKMKVAKIHEKIKNCRKDRQHNISAELTNEFDLIFAENFDIKKMMLDKHFAKRIADVGWGDLLNMISYKAEHKNKIFQKLERYEKTNQTCSDCGTVNGNVKVHHINWTCENCGKVHDKSINGAKNVLLKGIKQYQEV